MGNDNDFNTTNDYDHSNHSITYHDYGIPTIATLSFFLVVSMILAFGGNVMVIMTIVRHRGMRTRTNMLLGNLAVADILVSVLDMPIALITIINRDWIFSETFCVLNGFAVGLGLMLSVHTLMWISIHKFLSITRLFARNVTQFQIGLMMVCAWAWTVLYNLTATPLVSMTKTVYKKGSSQCGPVIPQETLQRLHSGINTVCNLVIPMAVMVFCYYRIFKEVKTHLERMRDFADMGMRNSLIQQKQITETLCIVLFVFFLFWAPYIVYSMSLVFCGETCVPLVFNPISYLCGYMNSACNPVIYALRSPSFRRGFKEIIFGTSSQLPGSVRQQKGVPVSFRKSAFRRSKGDCRTTRRENGSVHPAHTLVGPAPSRRPMPMPEVSVESYDSPVSPEVNGDAYGMEVQTTEAESQGHEEKVHFELESHTEQDLPSSPESYPPWQPLQLLATNTQLTRSCQHIVPTTTSIVTRSVSAGEILDMASHHDPPTGAREEAGQQPDASKRRHMSEVHRPLMWQASVDHLTGTPVFRRRRRCAGERARPSQHLLVRTIINNLRRSFSDLFNVEEH